MRAGSDSHRQVQDLQRDLRRLGYLKAGIDGSFGAGTSAAVQALQHDLMFNDAKSSSGDGPAPVRVIDYNRNRVHAVTGEADQPFIECISDILDDPKFITLPFSKNPEADNVTMRASLSALPSTMVPTPFLLSILQQESGLQHYREPSRDDQDSYIVVGFDNNAPQKYAITSRGYGAGQYTLFHHPPRPEEVAQFMLDPAANVAMASRQLRYKFDHFILGQRGAQADDRIAEIGSIPLRLCKHAKTDARYMTDCRQCANNAGEETIRASVTPLFEGCPDKYEITQYYAEEQSTDVPIRRAIGCDWPYAVRRYNGSGVNSYWYQARVLSNLARLPDPTATGDK